MGNIVVDSQENPTIVRVHLKRSKCDQLSKGAYILMGRTRTPLCPVAAILVFIACRGNQQGLLFLDAQHGIIRKAWFTEQIRGVLKTAGLPYQSYAGHSFRIGAVTTAALVGIEDSTIQMLGRWHSGVFLQYIRMPKEQLARLSSVMATYAQGSQSSTSNSR